MTDHAEALAKALEPGELSDERIKELAEAFQTHATRFAHDEICPERDLVSALAELAAYRSRPAAEVVAAETYPWDKGDLKPWVDKVVCRYTDGPTEKHFLRAGEDRLLVDYIRSATPTPALAGTEPAGEVVAELKRITDHLEEWARYHSDERTAETDAAIYCARQVIARAALRDQSEA